MSCEQWQSNRKWKFHSCPTVVLIRPVFVSNNWLRLISLWSHLLGQLIPAITEQNHGVVGGISMMSFLNTNDLTAIFRKGKRKGIHEEQVSNFLHIGTLWGISSNTCNAYAKCLPQAPPYFKFHYISTWVF